MAKKPLLAIDIDDVLSPHYDLLVAHLSRDFKTDLTVMDVRSIERLIERTGAEWVEIVESVDGFILSEAFYNEPLPGAIEAVNRLKTDYHLVIVTARPTIIEEHTKRWLEQHFPGTFANVDFVGGISWGHPTADKAPVLKRLGVKILIDDSPRHCQVAAQAGIKVILFGDYSWNQLEEMSPNITRANDWPAVLEILKA